MNPDRRDTFTDFELTIEGEPTEPQWDDLLARVEGWAKDHDLNLLGFASHRSSDDGETFRTVRDERDALRVEVERLVDLISWHDDMTAAAEAKASKLQNEVSKCRNVHEEVQS